MTAGQFDAEFFADRVKTRMHCGDAQDRFKRPSLVASLHRREGRPDSNDAHCSFGPEFSNGLLDLCIAKRLVLPMSCGKEGACCAQPSRLCAIHKVLKRLSFVLA